MSGTRKRATIRDVAEATGLSISTVSYALRGLQTSKKTQDRVRRAADELGYEADPIARALSSGKTGLIGVLCGSLEDLWQQRFAAGIGRALLAREHHALIMDAAGDPNREAALARKLRDQRVDGLVVCPLDPAAKLWAKLAEAIPVVTVGDALAGGGTCGVLFDNRSGVRLALEHLHALGHRQVALLTSTSESTPDRPSDRRTAEEAARLGLTLSVVPTSHALPSATEAAHRILASPDRPTAVLCLSDSIAYGVYAAAAELNLRIPRDVSVVGYDNHPVSALLTPPLTTVDWDLDRIISAVTDLILAGVEDEHFHKRITQRPSLREGGSTGRPPR